MRLACDLTGVEDRIVALAVTPVPPSLPLIGLPAVIDQRARDALRQAQDLAWCHGYEIETRLRRGRNVGKVIVLEAEQVLSQASWRARLESIPSGR
jgi:hypothetical protein